MSLASEGFTIRPPTRAADLAPDLGTRNMFIGTAGSGKTTGILRTLPAYYGRRQIIIADTKGDPAIERLDGRVAEKLRDLPKAASGKYDAPNGLRYPWPPVVIWRPISRELSNYLVLDQFCDWIYRRERTVLVLDELGQFAPGARAGPGLTSVFARGRTHEITVLGGTQRPKNVPIIAFTESQLFYVFRLLFEQDRKRVAEYTHPLMSESPTSPFGVKIYRVGTMEPIEYTSLL